MATAILRTEDCLKNTFHRKYFASRPPPPTMRPSRKKPLRSPPRPRSGGRSGRNPEKENADPETRAGKKLVMGAVKILRRGEPMRIKNGESMMIKNSDPKPTLAVDLKSDGMDLALCSTDRIGPDPKIVPKFADLGPVYAGPSVVASPPPNSLPFPAFFLKKTGDEADLATKGLRCLLRLDVSG